MSPAGMTNSTIPARFGIGGGPGPVSRKLRVEYQTEESFRREYSENIARGGIFIPTRHQLEMREPVELELVLAFEGHSVVLPGEVVHCIRPEMAATGAQPGVAIQFMIGAEEVRSKLGALGGLVRSFDERAEGTGRRIAPRYRARVPAETEIDGTRIAGHTRNLSISGALVAVPSDPPAIGRKVSLRLGHPAGSDQLEIGGVVARHVDSPEATCIGVEFRVPEADEVEVGDFISRVQTVEHSRRLGGINGPIADLGIRSVLAMFGSCAPEGMLTLTRGSEEGYITIDRGNLRAQVGHRMGREALDYLLSWTEGRFDFEGQADEGLVNGDATPISEIVPDAAPPEAAAPELDSLEALEPALDSLEAPAPALESLEALEPALDSLEALAPELEAFESERDVAADESEPQVEDEEPDDGAGELVLTDLADSDLDDEPNASDFDDEDDFLAGEIDSMSEVDIGQGTAASTDDVGWSDDEDDVGFTVDDMDSLAEIEPDHEATSGNEVLSDAHEDVEFIVVDDADDNNDNDDDSLGDFAIDYDPEEEEGEEVGEAEEGESEDEPVGEGGLSLGDDDSLGEFAMDDDDLLGSKPHVAVDAASIKPEMALTLVPGGERWDLSKTEEALLDLAAAGLTVAKAVDIIPEAEAAVYSALQNLLDEGLLTLE
jgi:Tfp pilus assembly protein PilZ